MFRAKRGARIYVPAQGVKALIVATAGHVDHGKTSLIRQLTGIETDTLAEEIQRGLSINLGYAFPPDSSDSSLGFIDVPGHQRFINTMISGVNSIDVGLLVISAADGPQPQTIEHIDVLDILGINQLTIVVSKIDKVNEEKVHDVKNSILSLLETRRWKNPPIFEVSNSHDIGIADLKEHLNELSNSLRKRCVAGDFRLSIDRSFSVKGTGLVVTGTASAGKVNLHDKLHLLPQGKEVRVREVRANGQQANIAQAGQRVALGVNGKIKQSDIQRGDWLVSINSGVISKRLDVSIRLLPEAPFALKHLTPIKFYLGAKRISAKLAIIESENHALLPNEECLAQIILDKPASAIVGDRFLIRDHSESFIMGGGIVLDPDGPQFGKSRIGRLDWLKAMRLSSHKASINYLLDRNKVFDFDQFCLIRNCPNNSNYALLPIGAKTFQRDGRLWVANTSTWGTISAWLEEFIREWHRRHPGCSGIKERDLEKKIADKFNPDVGLSVIKESILNGKLVRSDGIIKHRDFVFVECEETSADWEAIKRFFKNNDAQIPIFSDALSQTGLTKKKARKALKMGLQMKELHRLGGNHYVLNEQLIHYYNCIKLAKHEGQELTANELKQRFQLGRNLTIEVLEYFDYIGLTIRRGNVRILINSANLSKILGL